jgi:hypothetical protein
MDIYIYIYKKKIKIIPIIKKLSKTKWRIAAIRSQLLGIQSGDQGILFWGGGFDSFSTPYLRP